MRILIFNETMARGGVPSAIICWLESMLNQKHIAVDLLLYQNLIEYDKLSNLNCQIKFLHRYTTSNSMFTKLSRLLFDKYKLTKIIANYDIILVNGDLFQLTIPLMAAIKKSKRSIPVIGWIHACLDQVKYYPNKIIQHQHIYSLNKMQSLVCVSNTTAQSLVNYCGQKIVSNKILVIYNGANYTIHMPKTSSTQKPLHILAVGRFGIEKRFDLLIDAIATLNNKLDLKLTICGDGAELNTIKQKIARNNLKNIFLPGNILNLHDYYSTADIFVSSSSTEAFSIVVCEALSYSIPVIATRTGAAEILEDGKYGILIPTNDVVALTDAIFKLATDNNIYKHYMHIGHEALSKFALEKITQTWLNLFDKLLLNN